MVSYKQHVIFLKFTWRDQVNLLADPLLTDPLLTKSKQIILATKFWPTGFF